MSESPKKLEIHLQIEHKWGVKRESEVLDKSHDFDIVWYHIGYFEKLMKVRLKFT